MTDKQKRIKEAADLFLSGYNCAQSTTAPFYDKTDVDKKTILRASSAFGGGVAKLENVCGVVSGIALIFGLTQDRELSDADTKAQFYKDAQLLISKFTEMNDTVICADLLDDLEKNPPEDERYREKSCLKLVEDGAAILCEYFGIE